MSDFEKSSEQENWLWLREKSISVPKGFGIMGLLAAQADLDREIALQWVLIGLWEALLNPPK